MVDKLVNLEDLEEGDYLLSRDNGEVYEVVSLDAAEWDESQSRWKGVVEVQDPGIKGTFSMDASEVSMDLNDGNMYRVSGRVLNEPEAVLKDFAHKELSNVVDRLGFGHEYRGVDGVDSVAGLQAAAFLDTQQD